MASKEDRKLLQKSTDLVHHNLPEYAESVASAPLMNTAPVRRKFFLAARIYSVRNAIMGLTLVALRAGK
jgi:hypothetical protein